MIATEFIKAYNAYFGESVTNIEQITMHKFHGIELFQFAHYMQTGFHHECNLKFEYNDSHYNYYTCIICRHKSKV